MTASSPVHAPSDPQSTPAAPRDAADYGFLPTATGRANRDALQRATAAGGTITVSRPGTYDLAGTVYLASHTTLLFGAGVFVRKVADDGPFSHVLLNQGARTRTWDQQIAVHGLHLIVNDIDARTFADVFGLHGQIAFHYVRDLRISGFRCYDLGKAQYCIHVCTFEDLVIDDVIIHGKKDGVHLGRGRRFTIRNGVFKTFDDAIALNAHDYDVGNPELGWIENGIVENCHDLTAENTTGYFCRILAGAWADWKPGIEVQKSDTVVSNGRLYRVRAEPDRTTYVSTTRPTHAAGGQVLDGIRWQAVQDDVTYTAGVRNVVFRDIFLEKPRTAFSVHFDNDRYSRSYYPGAPVPCQQNLVFENISILHDQPRPLLSVNTPLDVATFSRCRLMNGGIEIHGNGAMPDYGHTRINLLACTFAHPGPMPLFRNTVPGKPVTLHTAHSTTLHDAFHPAIDPGPGRLTCLADLLPSSNAPR